MTKASCRRIALNSFRQGISEGLSQYLLDRFVRLSHDRTSRCPFLMAIKERFDWWIKEWDRSPVVRVASVGDVRTDERLVMRIGEEVLNHLA
jgi:hypothetical protein